MGRIISCCGCVCSECSYYPKICGGCANQNGSAFWSSYTGERVCEVYDCSKNKKNLAHCGECDSFPCKYFRKYDPSKTQEQNAEIRKMQFRNLGKSI